MSINTDPDALDRADMARLVAGQDRALDALMERHAGRLFNFLRRRLGDDDDANDLAQETFVRVYRARERYNPAQRFTTWLYTIASNLARNQLRWRARHPEAPLEPPSPEGAPHPGLEDPRQTRPDRALAAEERAAAVRRAVDALPEPLREVVVLCEWEDLPIAEAAAVLDTSPKAVETKLYRARKQLRAALTRWL